MKAQAIGYWICTVLVALSFVSGGAANLWAPEAIAGVINLGYPPHFVTILATWKILGGITVIVPGFARLKEWAYAGMMFDLTGAAIAHAVVGDSDAWQSNTGHIITPLVLAALVVASWALRPESRRLLPASRKVEEPSGRDSGLTPAEQAA